MGISLDRTITPGLRKMDFSRFLSDVEGACDRHGPFRTQAFMGRSKGCPVCFEERQARELEAERARLAAEARQRHAEKLLGRAAIPPRFENRRLETFFPPTEGASRALAICRDYAANFASKAASGTCLIFCGKVGTGKTHLAVGIAHEVLKQGRMAVFTSVLGAIRSVKETYHRDSTKTEREAIDALIEPDLLILDEVGVQFGSDTEKLILFEIINGRYEALKPTIVISNLAKDALQEYLGERVMDRLREGGGRMVVFDWESYRRAA